jgi:hypothetical protein
MTQRFVPFKPKLAAMGNAACWAMFCCAKDPVVIAVLISSLELVLMLAKAAVCHPGLPRC